MSVFCTPEGEPFFAGTYFPDEPRHGIPSFTQVLMGIADAWRERRADVVGAGDAVTRTLREVAATEASREPLGEDVPGRGRSPPCAVRSTPVGRLRRRAEVPTADGP